MPDHTFNSRVEALRTPPIIPRAARLFNLGVTVLVFAMMLAFGGWAITMSTAPVRILGGTVIVAASAILLMAAYEEWCSGEAVQHTRRGQLGFALFAIGMSVLTAGLASGR